MDFSTRTVEQLQERRTEIAGLIETDGADLDALQTEARTINEELQRRQQAESQRRAIREMVAAGNGTPVGSPAPGAQRRSLDELRASREYGQAYLNMIRTRDDAEVRALLTTNATGTGITGYIPVPTQLENEIRTAWEEHQIVGHIKHSYFKGNVKIAFELSATGASVHKEGTPKPNEETVILGVVEIKADMIKKWIQVSDEALEGTTVDTAGYLYREIAHKITEKAEEIVIGMITSAGTTATATAVGVPELEMAPANNTVIEALTLLAGQAGNLHIAMNRGTYAKFRAIEVGANYQIDAFEGLRDKILFTDKLPSYTAAEEGDTYMIVGDFGNGVQANFPNGEGMTMLTDPYTAAEADLVKIVGRQYVGFGIVADRHLVNIKKPAEG